MKVNDREVELNMQVGDLVWSLNFSSIDGTIIEKRLAIIVEIGADPYNPYWIQLISNGREGKTCEKYLEQVIVNKTDIF